MVLLILVSGACSEGSGAPQFTVSGVVVAGPTCPVMQDPPEPGCEDRPVEGALLLVSSVDGSLEAEVRSAVDGTFELSLPAGTYQLVPQPVAGLLGTAPALSFEVSSEVATELLVSYDTGIR